jgi:hypothetical protein
MLRQAFRDCMVVPAVQALEARVQKWRRLKDELRGFCYVKPRPYSLISDGSMQFELVGPKQFELLLMLSSVKLTQEDGSVIDRGLSFVWMHRHGEWKLQRNKALSCAHVEITIKPAGADEWTRVGRDCTSQGG